MFAHPAPETATAPVLNIPRRFVLFTTLLGSCSSATPVLAQDELERQPLPPADGPSELLAFSEKIHKLEVRRFIHLVVLSHGEYIVPLHHSNHIHTFLQSEAAEAYARRDFKRAVDALSELMYQQPFSSRWSEMRAQVLVDGKNFAAAVMDYNEAMARTPGVYSSRCHNNTLCTCLLYTSPSPRD